MDREEKLRRLREYLKKIAPQDDIESLSEEPSELVRFEATAAGADENAHLANEGIRKIARGETPEDAEMWGLEAIVLPTQRPVVDIVHDTYNSPPPPWTHLGQGEARANIEAAIPSIGRIEVPDHPSIPYAGTGFVVGDGLIMTNRHVAEIFGSGLGMRGLRFRPGESARIDFREERDPADPIEVEVRKIVLIHPYWDMALLKVEGLPAAQRPLRLSILHPDELINRDVAVVGYPAQDWRNDLDLQNRIFRGIYNVKRMQPGKAKAREPIHSFDHRVDAITHDSSTLGGNSGSAVIDVATGDAVGLHFAGVYLQANYAVPTYELARDGRVVDLGVNFRGTLQPTDAWQDAWVEADSDQELESEPPRTAPPVSAGPAVQSPAQAAGQTVAWTVPLHLSITLGPAGPAETNAVVTAGTEAPAFRLQPDPDYEDRPGYDATFLGDGIEIPLPWLTDEQYSDVAFNRWATNRRHVLPYHHFSVVMCRSRRLAYYTAVNIDGRRIKDISRDDFSDAWFVDPRIGEDEQLQNDLYIRNPLDRGHLVRRLDPVWGRRFADARKAHDDTFHWTNCSPQHERFNRNKSTWGLVEDWIFQSAQAKNQRMTVFTGPVFREDDPVFVTEGGDRVKIPLQFWKVVVTVKQDDEIGATAYLVSQDRLIDDLVEAVREPESFQKTVRETEELTKLSFHDLRDHDPLTERVEEGVAPSEIKLLSMRDIVLG